MARESVPLEAVTFDFWDTLCRAPDISATRHARIARLTEVLLAASGRPVAHEQVDEALRHVLAVFNQQWAENRQFTYVHAVDVLAEALGVELTGDGRRSVESAITGEQGGRIPDLAPGVADTLRRLKDAGVRLGIICDVGLAPSRVLRSHLAHHGVLDLFDHWSFSDDVGWYKPAEEIFTHALDGLGVRPDQAAHVGDLRRTDIAGALAMGMTAVRYAGITDDPADGPEPIEADFVVADHADLAALLLGS